VAGATVVGANVLSRGGSTRLADAFWSAAWTEPRGMPPTASEALRAVGEEQQRQSLATKKPRLIESHSSDM